MTFLMGSWYCAGWARDLSAEPSGITILEKSLVMFRNSQGAPVALSGRCPHRFAPLAQGRVRKGEIVCPYHGLRFGPDGQCVFNPHGDGRIPSRATVASYPMRVRNGALWVWMGQTGDEDEALLPTQTFVTDPAFAVQTGYLRVSANYQLVVDNLLDLSHGPFLHANTLLAPREGDAAVDENEFAGVMKHKVWREDQVIHSEYHFPPLPPTGLMRSLVDEPRVASRADMVWAPASTLSFDIVAWPPDGDPSRPLLRLPSAHYIVPETEVSSHYFFAIGRDVKLNDPAEDARMLALALDAFASEDEPMMRACQSLMGTSDLFSLGPVILATDRAAVLARRTLEKMIRGVAGNASPAIADSTAILSPVG